MTAQQDDDGGGPGGGEDDDKDVFPFRPSDHAPEILKVDVVFESALHDVDGSRLRAGFDLQCANYYFFDHTGERHGPKRHVVFERGDSVAVLPVIEATREVVLLDQFRIATYLRPPPSHSRRGWILETVAGIPRRFDDDSVEAFEDTAIREAGEETGLLLRRDELKDVGWYWSSPGGTSERVIVFLAFTSGAPHPVYKGAPRHEDRAIKVRRMKIGEFLRRAENGDFVDPKLAFAALGLRRFEAEMQQADPEPRRRLFAIQPDTPPGPQGASGDD